MSTIDLVLLVFVAANLLMAAWIIGHNRPNQDSDVTAKAIDALREMNTALLARSGEDRDTLMRLLPEGFAVMVEKHRLEVDLRKIEADEIKSQRGTPAPRFSIAGDDMKIPPTQPGWSDTQPVAARVM